MSARHDLALSVKLLLSLIVVLAFWALPSTRASADSITIDVSQDTWINSGSSNNWGDWQTVYVGSDELSGNEHGLFWFDLTGVPANAFIESATFQAYYTSSGFFATEDLPVSVHRLTKTWQESTATWPLVGNASDPYVYDVQRLGPRYSDMWKWISWDVTQLVREWTAGKYSNYGLALHGKDGPPQDERQFSSKEKGAGWGARLVVKWSILSDTPTATPTPVPTATPIPEQAVVSVSQDTWINSDSSTPRLN